MPIEYSVIVPAFKECGNLTPLTERLTAAFEKEGFAKGTFQIIIVDDNSRDGSVEAVDKLRQAGFPVEIIVRTKERGLSSAVLHGFAQARGQFLMCMDADLQHPPETAPKLMRALTATNVEFVIGTRYGKGVAIDKDWPLHRRVISWGARVLARPLTPLSDPMTGFFGLRREVLQRGLRDVSPIGYKIALELYVKCRVRRIAEVPFSFAARTVGESKLTGKVIVHYLKHLQALYTFAFGLALLLLLVVVGILSIYTGLSLTGLLQ